MAIVTQCENKDDFIIPLPLDTYLDKPTGKEKIIVAIEDYPAPKENLQKALNFYGRENCSIQEGCFPTQPDQYKTIVCVELKNVIAKSLDINSKGLDVDLSPAWNEEKIGMSLAEAEVLKEQSQEMSSDIIKKIKKYRKSLNKLKIKTDPLVIKTAHEQEKIILNAKRKLFEIQEQQRKNITEKIASFLSNKFDVIAWSEESLEPTVLFLVPENIDKENAIIIGTSIEKIMNEIEPEKAERFFDNFALNVCVWPMILNVSFDYNGNRITSKKQYYSSISSESSGGRS